MLAKSSEKLVAQIDWSTGKMTGSSVLTSTRTLGDLRGLFRDPEAITTPKQLAYTVQYLAPVPDGTSGGLFWGTTILEPGKVGDEYFMTKGHFHELRNRAEYYLPVQGTGALVLMDEQRKSRVEWMRPGTVHYIPGHTAHRVVNTGSVQLTFVACWNSDAGHDYDTIESQGFSAYILERDGKPIFVRQE